MAHGESRPSYSDIVTALREPETELQAEQMIGRYRLKQRVGGGQYGEVWRAVNTDDDSTAAVKVFSRAHHQPDSLLKAAERFWSGAIAMRKLRGKSDQIVGLQDGPAVQQGFIWFAMDYFPKGDLETRMSSARLPSTTIVQLMSDVLDALRMAHENGIVHRDVRPRNILLTQDTQGRLRGVLCDFDVAYYEDRFRQRSRTRELAEDRYLPPDLTGAGDELVERLRRPSNDLFALAAVTLDLFAAPKQLPLDSGEGQLQRALLARNEPGLEEEVCAALASFFCRAFLRVERERFQSVAEYERGWNSITRGHPSIASPARGRLRRRKGGYRDREYRSRSRWQLSATVAFLFGLLMLADWAYYREPYQTPSMIAGRFAAVCAAVLTGAGLLSVLPIGVVEQARTAAYYALARRPRLSKVLFGVAMITLAAGLSTNLPYRMRNFMVRHFDECVVTDAGGNLLRILRDPKATPVNANQRVFCPKGDFDRLSCITPLHAQKLTEHPVGFVALESVGDQSFVRVGVVPSAEDSEAGDVKRTFQESLWGVLNISSLDARTLETQLGLPAKSLNVVSLTTGHSNKKVMIAVDRQDLGRLLLRAGLADADSLATSTYAEDEALAKRAGRGRWAQKTPPPPPPPPFQARTLRVIVQRGPQRREDRVFGYYYRFEASPEVLAAISSIRIDASRKDGEPLNGPLAYKKCGTGDWELVSDDKGPERTTCSAASLHAGCECRLVLTSARCASRNVVLLEFTDTERYTMESFSACSLLGEQERGTLASVGKVRLLSSTEAGGWTASIIGGNFATQCGSFCGPRLARLAPTPPVDSIGNEQSAEPPPN